MKVTVKLFALLGKYLPPGTKANEAEMEVADASTPASIMDMLHLPAGSAHLVLINGLFVAPPDWGSTHLQPGDALAIWPPIAGG
jgi:sulfur carrier protein ThiS